MTKGRIALLGAAMTSALMLAGIGARAQDYYGPDDARVYDNGPGDRDARVYDNGTETVIVRPDYDFIQKHQVIGRVNGEINPTAYTLSRPVDLTDLDLTQPSDRREMRNRVYETAVNLCYELDARVPGLREDESADRECVRTATRDALRDVTDARYRE
jgi:UrcA family protein